MTIRRDEQRTMTLFGGRIGAARWGEVGRGGAGRGEQWQCEVRCTEDSALEGLGREGPVGQRKLYGVALQLWPLCLIPFIRSAFVMTVDETMTYSVIFRFFTRGIPAGYDLFPPRFSLTVPATILRAIFPVRPRRVRTTAPNAFRLFP
jgi:hypothetical protein